jgi:hypothetical protein
VYWPVRIASSKISAPICSCDLGIGAEVVAVPWEHLRLAPGLTTFVLPVEQSMIDQAPVARGNGTLDGDTTAALRREETDAFGIEHNTVTRSTAKKFGVGRPSLQQELRPAIELRLESQGNTACRSIAGKRPIQHSSCPRRRSAL